MKKFFVFVQVFIVFSNLLIAEIIKKPDYVRNDVRILSEAQINFDDQDFGSALRLIEEAKQARRKQIQWEIFTLQNSFKSPDVKIVGDNLKDIKVVLQEREDFEALKLIRKYELLPRAEIDNSKDKLLNYVSSITSFPEADHLAGDIYCLEGEYEIASIFYNDALKNSSILDVPDEKIDILYGLAEISYTLKDFDKYEKDLLLIVSQDENYKNKSLVNAMNSTISSTKLDCVKKFFNLYRTSNFRLISAYSKLSKFYEMNGALDKALNSSAFCVLTGFTRIVEVIKKRNPDFVYKDLASLLDQACLYEDIVEWGIENEVWKGYNIFADLVYKNTNPIFAVQLYRILSEHSPERYWQEEAKEKLKIISAED